MGTACVRKQAEGRHQLLGIQRLRERDGYLPPHHHRWSRQPQETASAPVLRTKLRWNGSADDSVPRV